MPSYRLLLTNGTKIDFTDERDLDGDHGIVREVRARSPLKIRTKHSEGYSHDQYVMPEHIMAIIDLTKR